jgi:hypothetical protein
MNATSIGHMKIVRTRIKIVTVDMEDSDSIRNPPAIIANSFSSAGAYLLL